LIIMGKEIFKRIVCDPDILRGKPVIKGTRISIEFLLELLANNWTHKEIIENYPSIAEDDILAALEYSLSLLKEEHIYGVGLRGRESLTPSG
jgi:uncharacterized protein (DUF433 family)